MINSSSAILWYFVFFSCSCVLSASLIFILHHRIEKNLDIRIINVVIKVTSIVFCMFFGASIINITEENFYFIFIPLFIVIIYNYIIHIKGKITLLVTFAFCITISICITMHIIFLKNINKWEQIYDLYENGWFYVNVFFLQAGISVCVLLFLYFLLGMVSRLPHFPL